MATATQEAPVQQLKYSPDHMGLLRYLSDKERCGIAALPKNLQAITVLASASHAGHVEFGRRNHSISPTSCKVHKGADGKPELDEYRRIKVDKEYKYNLDADWNWVDLRKPGRKPLKDVLAEDAGLAEDAPEDIRLHVRLTTAGYAQL